MKNKTFTDKMKSTVKIILFVSIILGGNIKAQEIVSNEKYGKTLNFGAGVGYYGYIGGTLPIVNLNFEFDVIKNFTLAPCIGFYSYQRSYYWNDKNYPNRYYSYKTTVIPIGLKGTYYFDELVKANQKWDFYAAGSIGFSYRKTVWENGYYGDVNVGRYSSPLYLDVHIGTEYHFTKKAGLFLDLSTDVSTIGLAVHF
jgi:hypothetical protein